ncbi:uncharacterized protein G2W53_004973 [Senna tora]|uniref:Uncharacterized protein n=1 Tax=Senna tora TaxID=362788 RepID=A0A834XDZ1_9FABA|nr:uncharacterized protein G2W53_004973 [Senna tora]
MTTLVATTAAAATATMGRGNFLGVKT